MGQYFLWFNCDKNQFIDAEDFDCSVKINGYLGTSCEATNAMLTLLASDWKNDRIILEGDCDQNANKIPFIDRIMEKYDHDIWDYALDHGENMSKHFKGSLIDEILDIDEERIQQCLIRGYDTKDRSRFGKREILNFKYIYNHTKKEYFRIGGRKEDDWFNPVSYLLLSAGSYIGKAYGYWISDKIGVTNDSAFIHNLSYKDMTDIFTLSFFDNQDSPAYSEPENKHQLADVYYRGCNTNEKNCFSFDGFDIKKDDLVIVSVYREFKAGKVQKINDFSDKYFIGVRETGKIVKVFDCDTSLDIASKEAIEFYPPKERLFRKEYNNMSPYIIDNHVSFNREEIEKSRFCACLHCRKIFRSQEVKEYSEYHSFESALCPRCRKMFVIGDASKLPITDPDFVDQLNSIWFKDGLYTKNDDYPSE